MIDLTNNPYSSLSATMQACGCQTSEGCTKTGYQYADISVPIVVKPSTSIGKIETECCGEPTVICGENQKTNACEIIITQKVCIKIPINYHVIVRADESVIDCGCGETGCD